MKNGEVGVDRIADAIKVEVLQADGAQCDRCRNYSTEVATHDYWPTYNLCPRCVEVLLDIGWPPFELREGATDDYIVYKSEADFLLHSEKGKKIAEKYKTR